MSRRSRAHSFRLTSKMSTTSASAERRLKPSGVVGSGVTYHRRVNEHLEDRQWGDGLPRCRIMQDNIVASLVSCWLSDHLRTHRHSGRGFQSQSPLAVREQMGDQMVAKPRGRDWASQRKVVEIFSHLQRILRPRVVAMPIADSLKATISKTREWVIQYLMKSWGGYYLVCNTPWRFVNRMKIHQWLNKRLGSRDRVREDGYGRYHFSDTLGRLSMQDLPSLPLR